VDILFVTWGGVIGWAMIVAVVAASVSVFGALLLRRRGRLLRFVASLGRARTITQAVPGERVVAFGRIAVDGEVRRAALASAEGVPTVRRSGVHLLVGGRRVPLVGAVTVASTRSDAAISRGGVASVVPGERALVVGRARQVIDAARSTYRDSTLALAVGDGDEPVVVLGAARAVRAVSGLAVAAALPGAAIAALGLSVAHASVVHADRVDDLGSGTDRVPAHLALPLLSPMHRDDALLEVDAWLRSRIAMGPSGHDAKLAIALRDLRPNCAREVAVAERFAGVRRGVMDGCDEAVVRALAQRTFARNAEAWWVNLWDTLARSPQLAPIVDASLPCEDLPHEPWSRVHMAIERPAPLGIRRLAALDLRHLALLEAARGLVIEARVLAHEGARLHPDAYLDAYTERMVRGLSSEHPPDAPSEHALTLTQLFVAHPGAACADGAHPTLAIGVTMQTARGAMFVHTAEPETASLARRYVVLTDVIPAYSYARAIERGAVLSLAREHEALAWADVAH
jgi:hypothetical protein